MYLYAQPDGINVTGLFGIVVYFFKLFSDLLNLFFRNPLFPDTLSAYERDISVCWPPFGIWLPMDDCHFHCFQHPACKCIQILSKSS